MVGPPPSLRRLEIGRLSPELCINRRRSHSSPGLEFQSARLRLKDKVRNRQIQTFSDLEFFSGGETEIGSTSNVSPSVSNIDRCSTRFALNFCPSRYGGSAILTTLLRFHPRANESELLIFLRSAHGLSLGLGRELRDGLLMCTCDFEHAYHENAALTDLVILSFATDISAFSIQSIG